jgi:hypothetical protein
MLVELEGFQVTLVRQTEATISHTGLACPHRCPKAVHMRWEDDTIRLARTQLNLTLSKFSHVVIDMPKLPGCVWGGLGDLGTKAWQKLHPTTVAL